MQAIITAERADNAGIAACLAVEDACLTMLEAARRDDWERVACLQAATEPMIADARRSADQALTPQQRREKLAIMRRIVLLDGEIRRLREPWQGGLERLFAPGPAADRGQALAR